MQKIVFITLLLALCCGFGCRRENNNPSLENTNWRLIKLVEGDLAEIVPSNVVITATFQAGRLTGNGGCNDYQASYTATDPQLSIIFIGATKIGCAALDWEKRYFERLPTSQSWKISGGVLTVQCIGATLVFIKQ